MFYQHGRQRERARGFGKNHVITPAWLKLGELRPKILYRGRYTSKIYGMVELKFNFKIVIISIQKSFLLLILIPFLSGLFHSYSNSISNLFQFLLSIAVKKSFPFPFLFLFPLMEISLGQTLPIHPESTQRHSHT